jgi:hypothetical protein
MILMDRGLKLTILRCNCQAAGLSVREWPRGSEVALCFMTITLFDYALTSSWFKTMLCNIIFIPGLDHNISPTIAIIT